MKSHLLSALVLVAIVLITPMNRLHAAVIYEYTGSNYMYFSPSGSSIYDDTMAVTGSFTVSSPLIDFNGDLSSLVTSYIFNDGIHTITDADGLFGDFRMSTDSFGNPVTWSIDVFNREPDDPSLKIGDQVPTITTRLDFSGHSEDFAQVYECTSITEGSCVFDLVTDAYTPIAGNWSVIPTPAALWLFGSGLLGLVGMARRKKA